MMQPPRPRRFYGLTLTLLLFSFSHLVTNCRGVPADDEQEVHTLFSTGFDESVGVDEYRYIVKFKNQHGFRTASANARQGGDHIMAIPKENSEVMTLKTLKDVKEMEERDDVEFVERDHKVYLQAESTPYGINMVAAPDVPDDYVSNQKVCIIDTGYDRGHPDLPDGADLLSGTTNGAGPWDQDGNGHGTHVAGTIAAIGGNDIGVVGVIPNGALKLHIVRVFNDNGNWAWGSTLIKAAEACEDAGSTVISMSLGGPSYSSTEESAFTRLYNSGIMIVAAAGNNGSTQKSYPASYSSVISVAAINSSKNLASFSQRNNQVDLAAPGVGVSSTMPGGQYTSLSGTSMATPHVSGVAALVWSHFPTKSAQEIREALQVSAEDLGSAGRDNSFGHGLVNAKRAFDFLSGGCFSVCNDSPVDWHDSDGTQYNCDWYSQGSNCAQYGDSFANFGKTANDACCGCGGGEFTVCNLDPTMAPASLPTTEPSTEAPVPATSSPTAFPTQSPTKNPTKAPVPATNSPTASPTQSPTKNPTKAPVPVTNSPTAFPTQSPTKNPTKPPVPATDSPTATPNASCQTVPENWYDSDGPSYNCDWYGSDQSRCKTFGFLYPNFGKTAREACCECGGGSKPCEDVQGWHDKDGEEYDCDWYRFFNRCGRFGNRFRNDGYTANEACCHCKFG